MNKKRLIQRIFMVILLLAIVSWIVVFFSGIIIPFIRVELNGDTETARDLLIDKGLWGYLTVALIPGLQMVVVFISAEFIQIAAGLAYPWWQAALLLDAGVVFGATLIWILVHTFKIDTSMFANSQKRIERYARLNRNTQLFMFLLFFMPFIPYGAIAYYGSSTKISYRRYILTCALGCLPSIFTSILMGAAINQFITDGMSIPLLIGIIIACAIILFLFIFYILKKHLLKDAIGTPDSPLFSIIEKYGEFMCHKGKKYTIINHDKLKEVEGPFIVISNHPGPFDYYRANYLFETPISGVANRHLVTGWIRTAYAKDVGLIPKKLFDTDIETVVKMKRMLKRNYSIYLCPDGRLSIDGTNYPYNNMNGEFIKKMKSAIALVKIKKAYLSENKWRKRRFNTPIDIEVVEVLSKEEIEAIDVNVLNEKIKNAISFNDFDYVSDSYIYKQNNKAKGLEKVLYMCPKCHSIHSMRSSGNSLYCEKCNETFNIQENYFFDHPEFTTIHEYYEEQKRIEKEYILKANDELMNIEVKAKIFYPKSRKHQDFVGRVILTKDELKFVCDNEELSFTKNMKNVLALAFSVDKEFEIYNNERLYFFYPTGAKRDCTRIALLVDVLKEMEYEQQAN